ncbi:MAG TPA: hypothetical protein VFT39_15845 [Vicinamibacterales bacterium]|nr:hypothetical protein [Vicinamibacterales bacterium]
MTGVPRAVGVLLAIAATVGLSRASSTPFSPHGEQAVLRLAWTARPERIEDCRQRSDEELQKLPAHMRQSIACAGTTATYRLEVRWNDEVILQQSVRGGGLRHDRPLYLFRDIRLPPGDGTIVVQFARVESVPASTHRENSSDERDEGRQSMAMNDARRRRELEERTRGREEAIPPSLSLERRLHLASRKVVLVTYDAERRDLVVIDGSH